MSKISPDQKQAVVQLIEGAGRILIDLWPKRSTGEMCIQTKADGSNVSRADFASNEILCSGLQQLFPDDGLLSEESERSGSTFGHRRVWIVDPLDGTRSFLAGRDDFSVLVALTEHGRSVFGLMHFPARGWLAESDASGGAYLNGTPLRVSSARELRSDSFYYRNYEPLRGPHLFRGSMDSGLAFLELARGTLDAVVIRMTHHREWDIAAPLVVIERAGGRLSDEHGNPIVFDDSGITYEYLVATNGLVHDTVLASLKPQCVR